MSEVRAKIDPANLMKLKAGEQKKMVSMNMYGLTSYTLNKTIRKIEIEMDKLAFEMQAVIQDVLKRNNMDEKEYDFKDIDFKTGEIVVKKKEEEKGKGQVI